MDFTYRERIEWHPQTEGVTLMASIDEPGRRQFRFGHLFDEVECLPGEDLPLPEALATARLALRMSYAKWVRDADPH